MGNLSTSCRLSEREKSSLSSKTGLKHGQIERLYRRFSQLDRNHRGFLGREDLMDIPGLSDNPLGERICQLFLKKETGEKLFFSDFVLLLAKFSSHRVKSSINTREEKVKFLFKIFDLEDKGRINREILLAIIELIKIEGINREDQVRDYLHKIFEEVDHNQDDYISYEEFARAMKTIDVEQMAGGCTVFRIKCLFNNNYAENVIQLMLYTIISQLQ